MTTITHAGNAPTGTMGISDTPGATLHAQIWWWVNPTTGAQNIIATPSVSCAIFGGAATFTGVDQTLPINPLDFRKDLGNSFGTVSTGIQVGGDNDMLFSLMAMANATSTLTAGGGATQAFNQSDTTPNRTGAGEYLLSSSHGMNFMNWSISGSTARDWAHQIVAINPVGNVAIPHHKFRNNGLRPAPFKPGLAR
jgi:hypothetical protein